MGKERLEGEVVIGDIVVNAPPIEPEEEKFSYSFDKIDVIHKVAYQAYVDGLGIDYPEHTFAAYAEKNPPAFGGLAQKTTCTPCSRLDCAVDLHLVARYTLKPAKLKPVSVIGVSRVLRRYAALCGDDCPRAVTVVNDGPAVRPEVFEAVAAVRETFPRTEVRVAASVEAASALTDEQLRRLDCEVRLTGDDEPRVNAERVNEARCSRCGGGHWRAVLGRERAVPLTPQGDLYYCAAAYAAGYRAPFWRPTRGVDCVNVLYATRDQVLRFLNQGSCTLEPHCVVAPSSD